MHEKFKQFKPKHLNRRIDGERVVEQWKNSAIDIATKHTGEPIDA